LGSESKSGTVIDLHTHTYPASDDSNLSPAELVARAKQAGLDGICLTEHDWFWNEEKVARLNQDHDFLILRGAEINTDVGHVLVFGLEKYILGMHSVQFIRRLMDETGGALILAHPFRRPSLLSTLKGDPRDSVLHLMDGIEVLNGRAREEENDFSLNLCQRLNLKSTGGSDAHNAIDIPTCATLFQRRITNLESLITELKEGRFSPVNLRQSRAQTT